MMGYVLVILTGTLACWPGEPQHCAMTTGAATATFRDAEACRRAQAGTAHDAATMGWRVLAACHPAAAGTARR